MYIRDAIQTIVLCVLLMTQTRSPSGPSPNAVASEDSVRDAIREVLSTQQAAWNKGDLTSFMAGYWNSPQLTFAGSSGFTQGWQLVLARYQHEYPNQAAMGHLDFSGLEVRRLGPDAAFVRGRWHLSRSAGDVGGIFTLIFQRFPEGWRIVHDHTSVVVEPAPGAG